jgi:hypothetical protein
MTSPWSGLKRIRWVREPPLPCPSMGRTNNDTDVLRKLEDLVPGSKVREFARRYRLRRYRHSDAQHQTSRSR